MAEPALWQTLLTRSWVMAMDDNERSQVKKLYIDAWKSKDVEPNQLVDIPNHTYAYVTQKA